MTTRLFADRKLRVARKGVSRTTLARDYFHVFMDMPMWVFVCV